MAKISVNHEVLIWARKEAQMNEAEAADTLGINVAMLQAYESGAEIPTLGVLRKMARKYGLPLATLAMPAPFAPSVLPKDYRTVDGRVEKISPETAFAIREARRYQEAMQDLFKDEDDLAIEYKVPPAEKQDRPRELAARERARLGVTVDEQLKWDSDNQALRVWRDSIEALGVFVYMLDMPIGDCRGFSLRETANPVIVISKDEYNYAARIFTLLHEYCHILRDQPGISNLNNRNRVERYCNEFAAFFLMPDDALRRVLSLPNEPEVVGLTLEDIRVAARKLHVSMQALALRLETAGYVNPGLFETLRSKQERKPKKDTVQKRKSGPPPDVLRLNEVGASFAKNVLAAYDRGALDDVAADRMLDLAPKHFDKLRTRLNKRRTYDATRTRP